eukprot:scaffold34664_cov240-Amphora_coffeaeformis.AAC.1
MCPQSRGRSSSGTVSKVGAVGQARQQPNLDENTRPLAKGFVLKPKRPRTAYNLFFKDQLKTLNIGKGVGQISSKVAPAVVSQKWASAAPSEKCRYYQLAADDKFRYCNEKIEYNSYMERVRTDALQRRDMQTVGIDTPAMSSDDESNISLPDDTSGTQKVHPLLLAPVEDVQDTTRPYSRESIAFLASKLDAQSIDFLIRALK